MPAADCPAPPEAEAPITYTQSRDPFAPGLLNEIPTPGRVVVLRASRIGDFVNGIPAFRALRQALPQAHLTLITLPMLMEIAERLTASDRGVSDRGVSDRGVFDRLLPFPGYPGLAEQFFDPGRALAFFQAMQAEAFDLAIQMQGSGVYSNPFTLMLGARRTAGFVRPGDPPGRLDAALPFPELHEARRNLALLEFLGLPTGDPRPDFPLWPADFAAADRLLAGAPTPLIGIHTSARDATRRWPLERFIAAAARLQERHGGSIVAIGEQRDRAELEEALQAAGRLAYRNLCGCTSLPVTGAVIHRLSVFLTNDTGPAHIAYASGAPTVAIFGGGDPRRNGPAGPGPFRILAHPIACRPCETGSCPIGLECLRQISVAQVVEAAEAVWAPGKAVSNVGASDIYPGQDPL